MRRVGVVAACPFPWPRGTPVRIHRVAEALALRGHDVHVATYHIGQELRNAPFTMHRIAGVPRYRRTAAGPTATKLFRLDPMLARLVRSLHERRPFDVIHAHHYEGVLAASWAGTRAPIVYDAHTTLAGELPSYPLPLPDPLLRAIGVMLDRRLPRRAARIISVSEAIREHLTAIGAVAADRIDVISSGVEFERFTTTEPDPGAPETVIYTGNLAPFQNADLLLDAFAALRLRRPGIRLVVATDSDVASYEQQARSLGVRDAVEFRRTGFDGVPALLAAAHVAVSPRVECAGIPQKLLNYMAAARPIVSFDGSAAILVHERTGLRVPNRDTGAMATAIERLLDDRAFARTLGTAARRQVERERSWDSMAQRIEAVFERAIADPQPARD